MSAIRWTNELLAECRNEKGIVFGMMSEEAREALHEVRRSQGYVGSEECRVECFSHSHDWVRIWGPFNDLSPHRAYRLSPYYTPPELEEKPLVDVPVRKSGDDILLYRTPLGNDKQLVTAQSCISFIGYVYANGSVSHVSPRRPCVIGIDGKELGPAEAPVAVRFWKGCAK